MEFDVVTQPHQDVRLNEYKKYDKRGYWCIEIEKYAVLGSGIPFLCVYRK
jgi:hypothetical protein